MSRSYKKTSRAGDTKGAAKKRIANKAVRQWLKDHPDEALRPSDFKKIYCSWNICDYESIYLSFEDYYKDMKKAYNNNKRGEMPSREELKKYWIKVYKRK